jgi:hypothetical protein
VNNLNLEGKRRKKRARKNNDDDDDDDVNDDVNDTHTRNKKQKETEPFTDQRENDLSIERTFISNQRQEKDAKRRRTKWKWPTIKKKKFWVWVLGFLAFVYASAFLKGI